MLACYLLQQKARRLAVAGALACCVVSPGAYAQSTQTVILDGQQVGLCHAFHLNSAGQWCPNGRVSFPAPRGTQGLGTTGSCFKAGSSSFGGRDIAQELDQSCR
jgi:hypothetical protein